MEQFEHANSAGTADPVDGQTTVSLEVVERHTSRRAEDAVGAPAVETEPIEGILEFCDVVTAQLWCGEHEKSVAEAPTRFDESQPGVLVTCAARMQAAPTLERGDCLTRGHPEIARSIAGRRQSG